jgi:N-carbamoylputrescine amidase
MLLSRFMRDLLVAAVCMHSEPGEVEKNLDRMKSFVHEAKAKSAGAVLFPELSLSGYTLKNPDKICDPFQSEKIVEAVVRMAKDAKVILMAGMVEPLRGGKPYITQIVAGPGGLLGLYRKTHLSPPEKGKYTPGNTLPIFQAGEVAFGLELCYESHFPEISTVLCLKGAEILFIPHASPRGDADKKMKSWLRHLPARAFDNGDFVVACNQVGKTAEGFCFPGVILALDPRGQVMESYAGDQEQMIFVDLKAEDLRETRAHRMKYFIPYRRNELYKEIVS